MGDLDFIYRSQCGEKVTGDLLNGGRFMRPIQGDTTPGTATEYPFDAGLTPQQAAIAFWQPKTMRFEITITHDGGSQAIDHTFDVDGLKVPAFRAREAGLIDDSFNDSGGSIIVEYFLPKTAPDREAVTYQFATLDESYFPQLYIEFETGYFDGIDQWDYYAVTAGPTPLDDAYEATFDTTSHAGGGYTKTFDIYSSFDAGGPAITDIDCTVSVPSWWT